jgi:hypothetical protein
MKDRFHWARLLAFVTGLVNQELLLRNEYLAAENRILRAHLPSRLRLWDAERFFISSMSLCRQAQPAACTELNDQVSVAPGALPA